MFQFDSARRRASQIKQTLADLVMNWDSNQIYEKVVSSADKYGYQNPQQSKQLYTVLSKCDKEAVFEALIRIFNEEGYDRQELAGALLYQIEPDIDVDPKTHLRNCLSTYNLSVEELPWYFAKRYGKETVLDLMKKIDETSLSENEKRSLNTIRFWLKNYGASQF